MTQEKSKIDALRRDLFMATANRGLAYTAILAEMREELGEERASQIFKRAIYNHGVSMAKVIRPPEKLEEFKDWLLDFFPDEGAMQEPEVLRCDEHELIVKVRRCPLKEAWRMIGLSDEEVADMCRHADLFDHGFFGSIFDYSMKPWNRQPDDACILQFRPKETSEDWS